MRIFAAKSSGLPETGNPLFPKARSSKTKILVWAGSLTIISLVIAALAVVVYGPYFALAGVQVRGAETLDTQAITDRVKSYLGQRRLWLLPNNHVWFFNSGAVADDLKQNFNLAEINVSLQDKVVVVNIVENISTVALRSGEQTYLLDINGVVQRVASEEELDAILVLREKSARSHELGETLSSEEVVTGLVDFNIGLRQQGITSHEFVSDELGMSWFTITSDRSFVILFDAAKDTDEQLKILQAVILDLEKTKEQPRYVDLRFGSHVFLR